MYLNARRRKNFQKFSNDYSLAAVLQKLYLEYFDHITFLSPTYVHNGKRRQTYSDPSRKSKTFEDDWYGHYTRT